MSLKSLWVEKLDLAAGTIFHGEDIDGRPTVEDTCPGVDEESRLLLGFGSTDHECGE